MGRVPLPKVLVAVLLVSCGCAKHQEPTKPEGKPVGQSVGTIMPAVGRVAPENDLRQVGIYYQDFVQNNGKAPASIDEFGKGLERDAPALYKAFKEGKYILRSKVDLSALSTAIVAYPREAVELKAPLIVVLKGDGSVQTMPLGEFLAALKAQGG